MQRWNRILDLFALARSFNFHRIINLIKVGYGYINFILFKDVSLLGLPIAVSIEPTTSCNLHCPECPTGAGTLNRPKGSMDEHFFYSIIDQISSHLIYLTLYFQGEPYLNQGFYAMITYARSRKIYVATSTNGHYLGEEAAEATVRSGLNRLIISLDGADQEAYSSYRKGGDFESVTEGIRRIAKWRKKLGVKHPYLIVQFLVFSSNEHQIDSIKKLGYELGADEVQLKSAQFAKYKSANALMPSDEKFSRYKATADKGFEPAFRLSNRCFRMWGSTVITWDGMVVPCCFDKNADHQMGSLADEDFKTIWENNVFDGFRNQIRHSRTSVKICCNCTQRW
jgi:radical SAM protein with 4Fe4S-binding SPASM domain